jgi:hypothetical protein
MSDERIDLTQFEDIPKHMEIKWHEHDIYGARYLIKICEPETPWIVGAIAPDFEPYDVIDKDKLEQEKMAKLFAITPNLIDELKRCYEEIDNLLNQVWRLTDIADRCGAWWN